MEYSATSEKFTTFKISKDDKVIGHLNYKNWFKFNAEIEILNSKSSRAEKFLGNDR